MMNSLTSPELTFLFMGVVVGLGAALVWMVWELEQNAKQPAKFRRLR
jgi:predicted negative regulator of RcsB-dependent stress response